MANLTLPNADAKLGECTCPNCGAKVELKIDPVWYRSLIALILLINGAL